MEQYFRMKHGHKKRTPLEGSSLFSQEALTLASRRAQVLGTACSPPAVSLGGRARPALLPEGALAARGAPPAGAALRAQPAPLCRHEGRVCRQRAGSPPSLPSLPSLPPSGLQTAPRAALGHSASGRSANTRMEAMKKLLKAIFCWSG